MKQNLRRALAHGANAGLVTAMVVGVLVLVYALADAYRWRVDLSEEAANSLQADTLQKLSLLDQDGLPVVITAFTQQRGKENSPFKDRAVSDLLREVGERSTVVEWRLVDFDRDRLTAESLGVTDYGHIVVQRGKERVDIVDRELFRRAGKDGGVEFLGEPALSRALSQLMTPSRRTVYVLSGHGELAPDGRGPEGLSELVEELDRERYDVKPLDLLRSTREGELPTVPDDAAVLFVARPKAALTPAEEDALVGWVGRGGPLLVAVDVGTPAPELLRRLGVQLPEGVALQPEMQVPYRDRPIPTYKSHAITAPLMDERLVTVLALPAPVSLVDPLPAGVSGGAILRSTRDGWIDRGGELVGGSAVYEPGIDGQGPVDMALALELRPGQGLVRAGKPMGRVVVIGDGDAFTNALLGEAPGNAVFAVNAVHWLAGDDRRLGVTVGTVGKGTRARRLALTAEDMGTLRWVSIGLMPGLVALIGVLTRLGRRGR